MNTRGLFTSTLIRKNGDLGRGSKRHSCVIAGACGQAWRKFRLLAVCFEKQMRNSDEVMGSCDAKSWRVAHRAWIWVRMHSSETAMGGRVSEETVHGVIIRVLYTRAHPSVQAVTDPYYRRCSVTCLCRKVSAGVSSSAHGTRRLVAVSSGAGKHPESSGQALEQLYARRGRDHMSTPCH